MSRKLPPIRKPAPQPAQLPKCLYCRRRLKPTYRSVYTNAAGDALPISAALAMKPTARDFDRWGVDGFFCSRNHGYLFALVVAKGCKDGTLTIQAVKP